MLNSKYKYSCSKKRNNNYSSFINKILLKKIKKNNKKKEIEITDLIFKIFWKHEFKSSNFSIKIYNLFQSWHDELGSMSFYEFLNTIAGFNKVKKYINENGGF